MRATLDEVEEHVKCSVAQRAYIPTVQLKSISKGISCTDFHTFPKSNVRSLKNSDLQRHVSAHTKMKTSGELATECKLYILYTVHSVHCVFIVPAGTLRLP